MPAAQPSKELHPLCHEHHIRMGLSRIALRDEGKDAQALAYACAAPNCFVHYSSSRGYFVKSQDRSTSDLDIVPSVRCPDDGTPMYLAEINGEKKSFRLWRCPQCDGSHTNEERVIGERS